VFLSTQTRKNIKEYYRLTKPGIIYGNALSIVAGFLLACTHHFNGSLLIGSLFSICLIMASGCVFNNVLDRNIDAKMDRTKKRAIASRRISVNNALIFGSLLALFGFYLLIHITNNVTVLLGLIALVDYVLIYGLAKRKTIRSTEIGAIAGALPPVAGFTAVTGSITVPALLLFLALTTWQMAHFYAIALFRQQDYLSAGLPVISVKRGVRATQKLIKLYIVLFFIVVMLFSLLSYTGVIFSLALAAVSVWWFLKAYKTTAIRESEKWARSVFKSSLIVLVVFCVFVSFGNHLR